MAYTTNDISVLFHVSQETIRNWTREFAGYFSVTANPEVGRTRIYTEDDLKVIDLIYKMREDSRPYEEIHASLQTGERGSGPGISPEELRSMVTGEMEKQLSLEIQMLRRHLIVAEEKVKEFDDLKAMNIRLEAEKEAEKRRADELILRLQETQAKLESLFREVGKAYHEGYIDALKNKRDSEE